MQCGHLIDDFATVYSFRPLTAVGVRSVRAGGGRGQLPGRLDRALLPGPLRLGPGRDAVAGCQGSQGLQYLKSA